MVSDSLAILSIRSSQIFLQIQLMMDLTSLYRSSLEIMENLTLSVIKPWLALSKLFLQKEKRYLAWEIIKFNAFMVNKKLIMKWKKLYQLRPNLKQSRSLLLQLRIKLRQNL